MTSETQMSRKCARCDILVGDSAVEGLCPRCLITDLLAPSYTGEVEADADGVQVLRYFGDYEFTEELSRGGMGRVFRARQVSLNRFVAVKIIHNGGSTSSGSRQKRFRVEAEAAARLQHPNIVPIYEFGEYGGEYFLSMKLIENARSVVELGLPSRRAVEPLIKIAHALHYAHQHGVLHRDIKPGNILTGNDGVPYLTDFGLAKLTNGSANLTHTQEMLGTPSYMAPEQVRASANSITTAVDIYGFGATLYECLAGRPPFEADSVPELLRKIVEEEPVPIGRSQKSNSVPAEAIDRDLETICFKCLEKDPTRRYASAAALAEDLELWRSGKPIAARPVTTLERIGKWARRKPASAALLGTAALALITMVIGGSWFNWRLGQKNRQIVEQVIRLNIDTGSRLEAASDPARAMLYFAEALRLAEANEKSDETEMLRLRFDSLLRRSPRLLQFWMHEGGANMAAFSPDGARVLSAGNDRVARLWDARTGESILGPLQHGAPVLDAFFSPDGRIIATLDDIAKARLWDASSGLQLGEPLLTTLNSTLRQFGRRPMAFDSSSRFFACGLSNAVQILDLTTHKSSRLNISNGVVQHLAFRPGGDELAIAAGHAIEIWKLSGFAPQRIIPQQDQVRWVGFSPDGGRLLCLLRHGAARIWDPESGSIQVELQNPGSSAIFDIDFSDDGKQIASGNFAGTVRVWDSATGSQLCAFEAPAAVDLVPFGNRAAVATLDGSVQFWDVRGAKLAPVLWHGGAVSVIALDPSGKKLVSACQDGSVRLWGLPHFEAQAPELDRWQHVSVSALSADKKSLLTCAAKSAIRLFDSIENKPLGAIPYWEPVSYAALSSNGAFVAAISWAPSQIARLAVWNREAALQFQLPHSKGDVRSGIHHFDFSPDGLRLAVAFTRHDQTGGAEIIDPQTGSPLVPALNHSSPVRFLDFDPEGRCIVTASDDRTARVWDARTGQPLSPPLLHEAGLSAARFSPDGHSLITACTDSTFLPRYAQVWNCEDYSPRAGRLFHRDGVLDAAFSPDNRKVATGGEDGVVAVWDALSGRAIVSLQQPQKVDHVTFSSDGRFLLVSCRNSSLRVLHVATGEAITEISYGGSTAIADFSPGNNAIVFAGTDGYPVVVPLASSALPADRLQQTAELLSNHKLARFGLEQLNVKVISAAWRSGKSESGAARD